MSRIESRLLPLAAPAPELQLLDVTSGSLVSLKTFAGRKALLVMFICRHCPYVKHVQAQLAQLGKDYANGTTVAQKSACAAKFGNDHSIGALSGCGNVAMFFGGSDQSWLAVTGNGQALQYPGAIALNGPALGLPVKDLLQLAGKQSIPQLTSASGFVRSQAFKAVSMRQRVFFANHCSGQNGPAKRDNARRIFVRGRRREVCVR